MVTMKVASKVAILVVAAGLVVALLIAGGVRVARELTPGPAPVSVLTPAQQAIIDQLVDQLVKMHGFQSTGERVMATVVQGNDQVVYVEIDGQDRVGPISWVIPIETCPGKTSLASAFYVQDGCG